MFKKISSIILVIVNALFLTYLLIPTPALKELPNSVRSTEPGDTVQLKNVSAYYTNLSRTEVMNFYKSSYNGPLLIRLNHPPELSKTIYRDTIQSYYLEEFVLPFKESIYINGFEWEKDVFTKPEKRIKNQIIYKNQEYSSKITIRRFPVSIPSRIITFFLTEVSIIFAFFVYKKVITKNE